MHDAPPGPLVEARRLTKRFGDFVAVDGIDLEVRTGEAFGLLGPNGAGKSSTMRMIGATSPRSDGELLILGLDPDTDGPAIRARLGVVPQEDSLDTALTVRENLLVYGRYFDLPRRVVAERADELLAFVQLTERANDRVDPLSGGMKRRLTIARGLVNRPEILLLDEPTTGLDPQARHVLWDRLHQLRADGVTLVLTTHYMDEAEQLCDRIVVMDRARVVAEGSPRELIERHVPREVVELPLNGPGAVGLDRIAALGERFETLTERVLVYTDRAEDVVRAINDDVAAGTGGRDGPVGTARPSTYVRRATLEDVFLRLTGRTLVD